MSVQLLPSSPSSTAYGDRFMYASSAGRLSEYQRPETVSQRSWSATVTPDAAGSSGGEGSNREGIGSGAERGGAAGAALAEGMVKSVPGIVPTMGAPTPLPAPSHLSDVLRLTALKRHS